MQPPNTRDQDEPSRLFLLPAEIRLGIYEHLSPLHNHPRAYHGLMATNRQLRKEFFFESVKSLATYYKGLTTKYPIRIKTTEDIDTLTGLHDIEMELPVSLVLDAGLTPLTNQPNNMGERFPIADIFLSQWISGVTFRFYQDTSKRRGVPKEAWEYLIEKTKLYGRQGEVYRVTLDWEELLPGHIEATFLDCDLWEDAPLTEVRTPVGRTWTKTDRRWTPIYKADGR